MASSPASIGVLVTNGQAQVDGAAVHGNSTLFQGSEVKASEITSDLRFADGANLVLQPGATAKVYRDHAELQQGIAMQRGSGHVLVADGLKVTPLEANGAVTIGVQDSRHVEMSAVGSPAEVRTPTGELVARLEPGQPLSFNISSGVPSHAIVLHGILRPAQNGHYLFTDSATNVTYELRGQNLNSMVGTSVGISGTEAGRSNLPGASSIVAVNDIRQETAALVGANGNGQAGGAAPAATGSLFTPGTVIFSIVIATGGAMLGLAASGNFFNNKTTPVSPQ
jgi:hypothetical protein